MPSETARPDDLRTMPAIREAILRVQGEYREMPRLSLTLPQAARLWGLDQGTCEQVLTKLIERRVLKRPSNGTYRPTIADPIAYAARGRSIRLRDETALRFS
jgi:hypothetical protein